MSDKYTNTFLQYLNLEIKTLNLKKTIDKLKLQNKQLLDENHQLKLYCQKLLRGLKEQQPNIADNSKIDMPI